eukprot:s261_g4.t1
MRAPPTGLGFNAIWQDPPEGAFAHANLRGLEAVLRQAAQMGKFTPDPLVSWSHGPSRKNFEDYMAKLTGVDPWIIMTESFDLDKEMQEAMKRLERAKATPKQVKGTEMEEQGELPAMVSQALAALRALKATNSDLEASKLVAAKVASAASKTAEEKFKAFAEQLEAMGNKGSSSVEALQGRKKLLESWVATQYEKTNHEVEKCESRFFEARLAFEALVAEMVLSSYDQYAEQGKLSKHQVPFQCDDEFLLALDAEFEQAMGGGQNTKETPTVETLASADNQQLAAICDKDPSDGEVPKPEATGDAGQGGATVTSAFEAMREAISTSDLPQDVKESLVGSVQKCVTKALSPVDETAASPAGEPIPSVVSPEAAEATVRAAGMELQRKDTSQRLNRQSTKELEEEELRKCAVLMEDGTYRYKSKKGKLETLEEREKRLSHNSYVAFSRSFEGVLVVICQKL